MKTRSDNGCIGTVKKFAIPGGALLLLFLAIAPAYAQEEAAAPDRYQVMLDTPWVMIA